MKRLKHKISGNKNSAPQPSRGRITNDDIVAHREDIIARGRRFKYPVQYAKHKLIINTIIISLVVLALLAAFAWWQLYYAQNTGQFFYRLTQIIPVPVAKIAGEEVRYSDYLLRYNGSVYWLRSNECPTSAPTKGFQDNNNNRQARYMKRQSLNAAEESAYVDKLAKKYNVSVSSLEVQTAIDQQRKSRTPELSLEAEKIVLNNCYGWSLGEYQQIIRGDLLRNKVAFAMDSQALDRANLIEQKLHAKKADFSKIASQYSDDQTAQSTGGNVGLVSKQAADPDGLLKTALSLKKGQVSGVIKGVDSYYIIKVLAITADQVNYARIKIELKEFDKDFSKAQSSKSTKEYIKIPKYN